MRFAVIVALFTLLAQLGPLPHLTLTSKCLAQESEEAGWPEETDELPEEGHAQNQGEPRNSWTFFQKIYESGRYRQALEWLQQNPRNSASYFYNLGTVYYRLKNYPLAYAYFQKANHLKPHDAKTVHNLRLAEAEVSKRIGKGRLDPASNWLESAVDHIPVREAQGVFGLIAFVLSLFWIRAYLRTRQIKKTFLRPAGLVAVGALFITMTLCVGQALAERNPPAAAIAPAVVRSGPGERYIELGRVEPGMKVRILHGNAENQEWVRVRFSGEGSGWVPASSLLLL